MTRLTDRELLELAAKAVGAPVYWSDDGTLQRRPVLVTKAGGGMGTMPYEAEWNPLKDDALALMLAVKLGMFLDVFPGSHIHAQAEGVTERVDEAWGPDPYAATRRAIVRAAAAIGAQS